MGTCLVRPCGSRQVGHLLGCSALHAAVPNPLRRLTGLQTHTWQCLFPGLGLLAATARSSCSTACWVGSRTVRGLQLVGTGNKKRALACASAATAASPGPSHTADTRPGGSSLLRRAYRAGWKRGHLIAMLKHQLFKLPCKAVATSHELPLSEHGADAILVKPPAHPFPLPHLSSSETRAPCSGCADRRDSREAAATLAASNVSRCSSGTAIGEQVGWQRAVSTCFVPHALPQHGCMPAYLQMQLASPSIPRHSHHPPTLVRREQQGEQEQSATVRGSAPSAGCGARQCIEQPQRQHQQSCIGMGHIGCRAPTHGSVQLETGTTARRSCQVFNKFNQKTVGGRCQPLWAHCMQGRASSQALGAQCASQKAWTMHLS